MMSEPEKHPFNDWRYIDELAPPIGTRKLIIGTAPPPRFALSREERRAKQSKDGTNFYVHRRDMDFFYGSMGNHMWDWLQEIGTELGHTFPVDNIGSKPTIEEIDRFASERRHAACEFLKTNRIWMKDVYQIYRRKNVSAKDADIDDKTAIFSELRKVLEECPTVDWVFFTSVETGALFFRSQRLEFSEREYRGEMKARGLGSAKTCDELVGKHQREITRLNLGERTVHFFQLPSPSSVAQALPNYVEDRACRRRIYQQLLFS
jgi:hypothetical protein